MEPTILEELQKLPESTQREVLRHIQELVARQAKLEQQTLSTVNRQNVFGIWQGQIWMADDFNAPLEELTEYME